MSATRTKPAERRKAVRQARSLPISWRLLGNRHLRFGDRVLTDIRTDGLPFQTDRVVLGRAVGRAPVEAAVVDRSLKGLGILSHRPFTRGTLLNVRPRDAHEKTASIQVDVRNCRQKDKQWLLGCHFLCIPPANV